MEIDKENLDHLHKEEIFSQDSFNKKHIGIEELFKKYLEQGIDENSDMYGNHYTYRIGSKIVKVKLEIFDEKYLHEINANN